MNLVDSDRTGTTPRPRGRTKLVLVGTAVLALTAAGAVQVLTADGEGRAEGDPAPAGTATARVLRTDLATRTKVDGVLGHAGSFTILAEGGGRATWLPAAGTLIRRGEPTYRRDARPIPLFYGSTPPWRTLRPGVTDGRDVLELERNLVALGHGGGMRADDRFDAATAAAVRRWQRRLGVPRTGAVEIGEVVVLPGAVRITGVRIVPGERARGRIMTASSDERQVTVNLPVAQQAIAVRGADVRIDLPGGRTTTGRVASVGSVASSQGEGEGEGGRGGGNRQSRAGEGTQTATLPVHIELDRPADAGRLDGAPVTVGFTSDRHERVLTVPVSALLAVADGTYAVRVLDARGRTRQVRVEPGMFADGRVEVGGALAEGQRVEVPRP